MMMIKFSITAALTVLHWIATTSYVIISIIITNTGMCIAENVYKHTLKQSLKTGKRSPVTPELNLDMRKSSG